MDDMKAISKAKAKQAVAEVTLKKKIRVCLSILPPDPETEVSVSTSMNSTFSELSLMSISLDSLDSGDSELPSFNKDSSIAGRRVNLAMENPQLIMENLPKLGRALDKFNQANENLLMLLDEDSDSYSRALHKRAHFDSLTDDLMDAVETEIWTLCRHKQVPLPSKCPKELYKWKCRNNDMDVQPSFVPPLENNNEDLLATTKSIGDSEHELSLTSQTSKADVLSKDLFHTPMMDKVLMGLSDVIKVVNTATIVVPPESSSVNPNAKTKESTVQDGKSRDGGSPSGGGGVMEILMGSMVVTLMADWQRQFWTISLVRDQFCPGSAQLKKQLKRMLAFPWTLLIF